MQTLLNEAFNFFFHRFLTEQSWWKDSESDQCFWRENRKRKQFLKGSKHGKNCHLWIQHSHFTALHSVKLCRNIESALMSAILAFHCRTAEPFDFTLKAINLIQLKRLEGGKNLHEYKFEINGNVRSHEKAIKLTTMVNSPCFWKI